MTEETPTAGPPAEISHLVRERTEARTQRNWARADLLKAQIEAAGWRVIDRGKRSSVVPIAPPDAVVDGETRYGSAASVPSVLGEAAAHAWTVVIPASEEPARISRLLSALRAFAPNDVQVVIVANDPSLAQAEALLPDSPDRSPIGGVVPEVLRTSTRLGYAAALNIAMRRVSGELVLLADGTAWPTADAITPLAAALGDPAVAAAGGFGLRAAEEGPLRPNALSRAADEARDGGEAAAGETSGDTTSGGIAALEAGWLAFRRSDYVELGPFDEHFVTPSWLDVWWTLRLRCGADPDFEETPWNEHTEDAPAPEAAFEAGAVQTPAAVEPDAALPAPRKAAAIGLPLLRDAGSWPPDRSRLNRRNMYRVLDRFGWRDDLG